MKLKMVCRAICIKCGEKLAFGRKSAMKSYLSIFLVLILLMTSTFAWFSVRNSANVTTDILSLSSASVMRTNEGVQLSNNIRINDFVLDEATSVDGRNMFFPTTGTFSTTTAQMNFREGNSGDRNVRYVYKDFSLTGGAGITNIYIKGYTIKIGADLDAETHNVYQDEIKINYDNGVPKSQEFPDACPIRIAFIEDSGKPPIVIDPSAKVVDFVTNYNAVNKTDAAGVPLSGAEGIVTQSADSFSSYYYMVGDPIFTLIGGQKKNCTMVVWLEGTAGDCDQYVGKKISVDVDIESNFENYDTITFVDNTLGDDGGTGYWVGNDNMIIAMSYLDPTPDMLGVKRYKTVIMQPKPGTNNRQWVGPLPSAVTTDISFYRLSRTYRQGFGYGVIYNSWHTKAKVNNMLNDTAKGWRTTQKNIPCVNTDYDHFSDVCFTDAQNHDNDKSLLQESRNVKDSDGKVIKSVVYTARRGNGYFNVDDTSRYPNQTDAQRMEKWLSPCIGYWEYEEDGGSTPPVVSTDYQLGITLNISDSLWSSKTWIKKAVDDGKSLQAVLQYPDGTTGTKTIPYTNKKFELSQSSAFTVPNNTKITGFRFSDGQPFTVKDGSNSYVTVTQDYWYNFQLNNDDCFVKQ